MVPIRVREVLEATDGTLLCGDIESVITDVVTDSRSAKEGTLFVPGNRLLIISRQITR